MKFDDGKNKSKHHSLFFLFSYHVFQKILKQLDTEEQGIDTFTSAYKHFGIHINQQTNEINIKEWAPGAKAMYIRGDFSLYTNYN
jgi:1,4-alpha-glucan branching enzyme